MNKGLVFGNENHSEDGADIVTGYVDSDFAGCLDTRKSLIGYVFTILVLQLAGKQLAEGCSFILYRSRVYGSYRGSKGGFVALRTG